MATISEKITALEEAMASGTTEVQFSDGKRVRYADQAALERAVAYFRAQERSASGRGSVGVSIGAVYRG
jgi:hypothetical protein